MARPAQQGHRPLDRLQLRSLYGFLNRQDRGDLPLRHEGRPSTFDELQLRHQRGFLHCLTMPLSLRNTGTTTLSKGCTRAEKNRLQGRPQRGRGVLLFPPLPSGGRGGPVPGRILGGRERLAGMDLGAQILQIDIVHDCPTSVRVIRNRVVLAPTCTVAGTCTIVRGFADTLASVRAAVVKMRSCAPAEMSSPPRLNKPLSVDPLRQIFA